MRLKNHHLAKLENKGRVTNFEKLLGEIIEKVHDFPAHLDLHEQGKVCDWVLSSKTSVFCEERLVKRIK